MVRPKTFSGVIGKKISKSFGDEDMRITVEGTAGGIELRMTSADYAANLSLSDAGCLVDQLYSAIQDHEALAIQDHEALAKAKP